VKIILEWILGVGWMDVGWINQTHDSKQWRALLNTVLAFQERLYTMELDSYLVCYLVS
jgi:hypothetical protein